MPALTSPRTFSERRLHCTAGGQHDGVGQRQNPEASSRPSACIDPRIHPASADISAHGGHINPQA